MTISSRGMMAIAVSLMLVVSTWLAVLPQQRADAAVPTDFYQKQNGTFYHYVRESGTTFTSIKNNINNGYYADRGVTNLFIYCPYKADSDWRGVPAIDFFSTNANTGTVSDFEDMVEAAHDHGISVSIYISTLFVDTTNQIWIQAQQDKANGINSVESKLFRWSSTGSGSTPDFGGWAWSSTANSYYATSWGHPAIDMGTQEGRDYIKSVLAFWMDLGVDGFEYDAPTGQWGGTTSRLKEIFVDYPNSYTSNSKYLIAEGHVASYTYESWNNSIGFTHVLINGDDDTRSVATDVMNGTLTANGLENHFATYLDPRRAAGQGVRAVSTYASLTGDQRALEAAVLAGNGALFQIDYDEVYSVLSSTNKSKFDAVFKALASTPAQAPGASRTRLSTGSDSKYYAIVRTSTDGTKKALNIYNFKNTSANITVNLSGSGIPLSQTPVNLVTGASAPPISSTSYTVTLPAYGFLLLDVTGNATPDTTPPSAPSSLTATAVGSTSVSMSWTASTDDVGVVAYDIYRNSTLIDSISGVNTTYTDTMLTPSTSYAYTVKARDAADNESAASNTLNVTTSSSGGGGLLTGSLATTPSNVNLSSEGSVDWAHWGLTSASSFNHKNGVTQKISNYATIGTGDVYGYDDNDVGYSWSGGTPTSSASNSTTGIWIPGIGNGFQMSVPAGTTQQTLKVYLGVWSATGTVNATLSDGSAAAFSDSFNHSSDTLNNVVTLHFKAASEGQTLTVTFTHTSGSSGNVTLQAATLQ